MNISAWFLALSLFVLGCSTTVYNTIKPGVDRVQTFALTPEGWWIIFTNDQDFVARMCDSPGDNRIIGCARWPTNPEVLPAKHCVVSIYTNAEESAQSIVEHELRHCREGSFHKD